MDDGGMVDTEIQENVDENDLQTLAEDDQAMLDSICELLTERPHLAEPLARWMIPDLCFAPSKALTGVGSQRFDGKISFVHQSKGFGFIVCPAAKERFGVDVFLHHAQRGDFQIGAEVSFAVLMNKDGKPQAFDLVPAAVATAPPVQQFIQKESEPHSRPRLLSQALESSKKRPAPVATNEPGRYTGTITAFMPEKGFGFINSPAVHKIHNLDVWLHHQQILDFQVGDEVTFTMILSKAGKPQAIDLASTSHMPAVVSPPPKRPVVVAAAAPAEGEDRHIGTIAAFYPEKGYGFIGSPGIKELFGVDVWLHGQQMGNFNVGDEVSFTLITNKDGKPQALDLGPVGAVTSTQAGIDRYIGTITEYLPAKGFGFIHCPEIFQLHGLDVWLHNQQIGNFNVGETVSFTMILNKQGKPQAIDLADGS